jgi:hypothetical protein
MDHQEEDVGSYRRRPGRQQAECRLEKGNEKGGHTARIVFGRQMVLNRRHACSGGSRKTDHQEEDVWSYRQFLLDETSSRIPPICRHSSETDERRTRQRPMRRDPK